MKHSGKQFWSFSIALLLWLPLPVSASDLLSVYKLAQTTDPEWRSKQAANKAAQESSVQSRANFLPTLDLTAATIDNDQTRNSALSGRSSDDYNSNTWSLNLTQPVFRMASYSTHRQAKATVKQADAQLEADAQDLIIRVVEAYFNVLAARTELNSVQAEKKAIARQLEQAQRRFDVGLIAITDVHEAQASYDLATANEIQAQNNLSLARVALSEITGQTHEQLHDTQDELALVTPEPDDIEAWVDTALQGNRSLAAAQANVEVAQEEVKVQRAGHFPTLDLVATKGNSTSHGDVFGNDTDSATVGLQFSMNLFAGGAINSRTRQALARQEEASEILTQTRRATERLTRNAYLSVVADISRIQALKQAVVSAQSAVDATEAGFEVGTRTIVDVLNVQRDLYRSRANYQTARYTYLVNGLRLKQAAGSLADSDVEQVNQYLAASINNDQ